MPLSNFISKYAAWHINCTVVGVFDRLVGITPPSLELPPGWVRGGRLESTRFEVVGLQPVGAAHHAKSEW